MISSPTQKGCQTNRCQTAIERVAHKLKCDSVLLLKVYTYRHICIHVYIFLFYIISIYHSISVNKVKSVSKNPKGNKCDKGHSRKPFYIIVVIHFFDYQQQLFKIPYLQKNTTKHADKIKEYSTVFIVFSQKVHSFQRLCHLHHSLHCTYSSFFACFLKFIFLCVSMNVSL